MENRIKLSLLMKVLSLTQRELAIELGVSKVTINRWVNNRVVMRKKNVNKLDSYYFRKFGQKNLYRGEVIIKKELIKILNKKYKDIIKKTKSQQYFLKSFIEVFVERSHKIYDPRINERSARNTFYLAYRNHYSAAEYLVKNFRINQKIDEDFIIRLHQILMNGLIVNPGEYRRHGKRIIGAIVPTPNYYNISRLMRKLVEDINCKNQDIVEHVAKIYAQFLKIQPFSDGNGRLARLIFATMLLRKNYPLPVFEIRSFKKYYIDLSNYQRFSRKKYLESFVVKSILSSYRKLFFILR